MIDVVLPVLNERPALPWVIGRMPDGFRPIVVDNGSTDGSGGIAREIGAEVVDEPVPGFGAACLAGLIASSAEVVCFMDADGSLDPLDLPPVCEPLLAGRADLVLGRRIPEWGAWPLHARIANRVLAAEVARRTGINVRDLGPTRAARRNALLGLGLEDRRFGWPLEMVLRAASDGWTVTEVEVGYRPRVGSSKVTGTVRGTTLAMLDMIRVLR